MSCTNPLHAFDTGFKTENGKPLYKITGKDVDWIYKPRTEARALSQKPCDVWTDWRIKDFIEIPCGKCISCRLQYSKEWANRCMLEAKMHKENYFITLTYSQETVPYNENTGALNLKPKDLQDFLKRLRINWKRKYNEEDIKFYACGEYGSTTSRPHYHVLAFNLNIKDLEKLCLTKNNDQLYTSEEISKTWGKGNVWIAEVNWNTCAYVSRYIMKKQKGPGSKEFYEEMEIEPEFVRMSRRPGIGQKYFEENKEKIYKYDDIEITKRSKKHDMQLVTEHIKPSRYYDKLYDLEDHEFMEAVKQRRKSSAKAKQKLEMSRTTKTRNEYLEDKGKRLEKSIKALKREIE